MKTLTDFIVTGALYERETGPEAMVGDQVKLFLNTDADPGLPEYVVGVIQHPIVKVQCGTKTSYSIEYDEADLDGAVDLLVPDLVAYAEVVSAVTVLSDLVANLTSGGAIEVANSTGNTTVTVPERVRNYVVVAEITGSAGTRIFILDEADVTAGTDVTVVLNLPTTASIVVEFRAGTAGGTLLDSVTTDTSGDNATFRAVYTDAWNKVSTLYPN